MTLKRRNLSILVSKLAPTDDFTFDHINNSVSIQPMSAPPTTLGFPKNLFPLNEACESCDACTALAAGGSCKSPVRDMQFTNGLGSASSTRRRAATADVHARSGGRYRRHPTILPTRHRGAGCRVPMSHIPEDGCEVVFYDTDRSTSLSASSSTESSPATTPIDEHSSSDLDMPFRSLSLGSLSMGSASTLDLSKASSGIQVKFKLLDKSFF